jgi:exodeoxyribonuclease VIII
MNIAESIEGMSYRDYNARPGLRASYLSALDKGTPASAEYERTHPTDTPQMKWGRALHSMILEPETFGKVYHISSGPVNPRTQKPYGRDTDKYLEWEAAQTKPILSTEDHRIILGMADSVAAHPLARTIRDGPRQTELSIFWKQDSLDCKARIDCFQSGAGILWDLKSCSDASYDGFWMNVRRYRYYMAAAWYMQGLASVAKSARPKFLWLAVENSPPYSVGVYEVSFDLLQVGYDACCHSFELAKKCAAEKNWPAYREPGSVLMTAPKYMLPEPEVEI